MDTMNTHAMILAEVRNGVQYWQCQHCPRRILISRRAFVLTVVVVGDVLARHSGSTGGVQLHATVDDLPPIGGLGDVPW